MEKGKSKGRKGESGGGGQERRHVADMVGLLGSLHSAVQGENTC